MLYTFVLNKDVENTAEHVKTPQELYGHVYTSRSSSICVQRHWGGLSHSEASRTQFLPFFLFILPHPNPSVPGPCNWAAK